MDFGRLTYQYRGSIITTLLDDGMWWASVRLAGKAAGGDQPVLGGPWGLRLHAQHAAQFFCDSRPASGATSAPR